MISMGRQSQWEICKSSKANHFWNVISMGKKGLPMFYHFPIISHDEINKNVTTFRAIETACKCQTIKHWKGLVWKWHNSSQTAVIQSLITVCINSYLYGYLMDTQTSCACAPIEWLVFMQFQSKSDKY